MQALASVPAPGPVSNEPEARVTLYDVPWAAYVVLRDALPGAGVRMTYLEGSLEIMSPSREHEVEKTQVGRLLELFCLERDIPLYGYGSTTFRKEEKLRGLEPDECYARGRDAEVPDVAIEVVKSRGAIDKLDVYRKLGVREVWIFEDGTFTLFELHGEGYESIEASAVFPEVDLARIAHFAVTRDQHAALRAYRDELRAQE